MEGFLKPYQVEQIKKKYPVGTKIQLDHMDGERDMPDGLLGEIKFVDDQGGAATYEMAEWKKLGACTQCGQLSYSEGSRE